MVRIILYIFICFIAHNSSGQEISFGPEVLIGKRSVVYQHSQHLDLSSKWSYRNNFLLDNAYKSNHNRIYFFRNTLRYSVAKGWHTNLAFGLKNPGVFSTISGSFLKITEQRSVSYSIGVTFQKGWSLEQSLLFRKNLVRLKKSTLYYQVFALVSLDETGYLRGIQQIRIGIQKGILCYGIGFNFDQFNNATKTLTNQGVFLKLKINKSYNNEK